jgi:hypothetical protein
MKFLFQTDLKSNYPFGFQHVIKEALEYREWSNRGQDCIINEPCNDISPDGVGCFRDMSDDKDHIPVGSVQFVEHYLRTAYGIEYEMINIEGLTRRNLTYITHNSDVSYQYDPYAKGNRETIEISNYDKDGKRCLTEIITPKIFRKDVSKLKSTVEFINVSDISISTDIVADDEKKLIYPEEKKVLVSDFIDITSEYRCFVHNNVLVGLQWYNGSFRVFPDVYYIDQTVNRINTTNMFPLGTYSFDVAVLKDGSCDLLEIHDFFSLGLYGFEELNILPQMLYRGIKQVLLRYEK